MSLGPEFSHIETIQDDRFAHPLAMLLPGHYVASRTPIVVYTVLGSCVAVCLRDPVTHVGGVNHFVLPVPLDAQDAGCARYGTHAMGLLLDAVTRYGAVRERLELKLFGGAHSSYEMGQVGRHNVEWILSYCRRQRFAPAATDFGGELARCVYYDTGTGRVLLRRVPLEPRPYPPGQRRSDAAIPTDGHPALSPQGDAA